MTVDQSKRRERREAVYASMRELRLSVIVPVFNEARNIQDNLELLIAEILPYFSSFEILVVSDGSTDGTNTILSKLSLPNVRCIINPQNRGKGFAVREGLKAAGGDFVFFIDGGMELHPREIRIFLGLMSLYESDIVIGSKRHPQSRVDYPRLRRILSFFYQRLVHLLFDLNVTDTQVGIKLFRREVIDAILPDLEIDRYGFDLELLALARRSGFRRFLEAPIRLDYFRRNSRGFLTECMHVAKVGLSVTRDTIRLYFKLRKLPQLASPVRPIRDAEALQSEDKKAS